MKKVYIFAGLMMIAVAGGHAGDTNIVALQDVSWFKKTFSELSWQEIVKVVESPKDIASRVKNRVDYKSDKQDQMKTGSQTWEDRKGDCEDFAECVVELCLSKGFESWVEVYFQENSAQAHAVAMGRWNGKLWMSSNGSFQFVDDEKAAGRVVARDLGWRRDIVHSESYALLMSKGDLTVALGN